VKLKKAMKLYPIEVLEGLRYRYTHYKLNDREIFQTEEGWEAINWAFRKEKEAVAWLIEGAEERLPDYVVAEISFGGLPEVCPGICPHCGKILA